METNSSIGMRIRELRNQREYSEAQMASLLDVTFEEYRDYENDLRPAPFSFYFNLAKHFGMDVSSIISGESSNLKRYTITRDGQGFPLARRSPFTYLHQAIHMKARQGEPFIVTAPYLGETEDEVKFSTHPGQEFVLILSGTMRVILENNVEILREGDSMYFDGRMRHGMSAMEGKECKFLSIVMSTEFEEPLDGTFASESGRRAANLYAGDGSLLYREYMSEEWNVDGSLKQVHFKIPEDFNFAFDVLDRLAVKSPNKIAMRWLSNEKEKRDLTFKMLSEESSRAANFLRSLGVGKGDRVMLVLRRHYQFWVILNALHKLGAVAVPAPNQLTCHDYEYRFRRAHVKCLICVSDPVIMAEADAAQGEVPAIKLAVGGGNENYLDFDALYKTFPAEFERPADHKTTDPMLIFFSSGTTGYPKMVLHDYSYPLGHIMTARYWHKVNPNGLHFTVADTGWGKALWGKIYGQWLCEAGVFTYDFDRFHAADLLGMFKEHNITTFCAPPTIFRFIVKEDLSKVDFSTLEHVTTAGEAMPPEVSESFARVSGQFPHEGFGQTETALLICTRPDMTPKPGSMGKPNPQYQLALLGHDGKPVAMGDTGEICVKAEPGKRDVCGLFCEYIDSPEDNSKVWRDGYYHTGDLAWCDEDGYYWYVGRDDDIIKTSGYRVGPFEVESVLMELPYILECAVTGVPDPVRGKVVKATIVLVPGKTADDALVREIQEYVKHHTAPYKYPRQVEFVKELPKTVNGKIRRAAIRAEDAEK